MSPLETPETESEPCGSGEPDSWHVGWALPLLRPDMAALCPGRPGAFAAILRQRTRSRGSQQPACGQRGRAGMHPVPPCPWQHGHAAPWCQARGREGVVTLVLYRVGGG